MVGWNNAPSRPPSGFGGGMTPVPRSQDLTPVIPNPSAAGDGWSTTNRPPVSFGGGMTPSLYEYSVNGIVYK